MFSLGGWGRGRPIGRSAGGPIGRWADRPVGRQIPKFPNPQIPDFPNSNPSSNINYMIDSATKTTQTRFLKLRPAAARGKKTSQSFNASTSEGLPYVSNPMASAAATKGNPISRKRFMKRQAVAQEQGLPRGHQRIAHDQLELLQDDGRHLPFVDARVSR